MKIKDRVRLPLIFGAALMLVFILFTVLVKTIDLSYVPPKGTPIGFSSLNCAVFEALGTNDVAYYISEALGLFVLVIPFVFAVSALVQWIKRKSLFRIDRDLWVLFAAYALTLAFYCFFEIVVINYRPIRIDGVTEASYPSSHTLLAIVIAGISFLQIRQRIKKAQIRIPLLCAVTLLMIAIPVLRLLSGVHWVTDIVAAILLGSSIIFLYHGFVICFQKSE